MHHLLLACALRESCHLVGRDLLRGALALAEAEVEFDRLVTAEFVSSEASRHSSDSESPPLLLNTCMQAEATLTGIFGVRVCRLQAGVPSVR